MLQKTNQAIQILTPQQFDTYLPKYDNFYIGSNTCPFLLPQPEIFQSYLKKSQKNKKRLTLLTPLLPNNYFEYLDKIIKIIKNNQAENIFELVFNDWGGWDYLKNKNIKLIAGIFIANQKKDPYYAHFKTKFDKICTYNVINNPLFADWLLKNEIDTIELENLGQGIALDNLKNLKINLYTPYIIFSLSRTCPLALIKQANNYLKIIKNCPNYCLNPQNQPLQFTNKYYTSFYKGNFQTYKSTRQIEKNRFNKIINNSLLLEPKVS
ncbi:MAG: hypothetical protein GF365_00705 [Candidatus Buchananbacteria bacterium]|nr:hypothetical protein [Candidatus Buchananbacteria bacterium]